MGEMDFGFEFKWEAKTVKKKKKKKIHTHTHTHTHTLEIQLVCLSIGSDVVLQFHHMHFTYYQPVQEEEEKAICFERRAVDHIQGLTHKSLSKRHDTSARIKRNFLIKTIIPVCLRSVFIIRSQAHLCACTGPSKCSALCTYLFSVLPPCV